MGRDGGQIAAEGPFEVVERLCREVSDEVERRFTAISRVVELASGNEEAVTGLVLSEDSKREIEDWVRRKFENRASIGEG